ncbi:MAG: SH3 domain-containing protein [Clostridia bacterium]|nr:SH3 domain-containing protein [Clostridia bacterium]
MKKHSFLMILLILVLVVSAAPVSTASAVTHTEYVRNPTGRTVNVRQGPGKGWTVDAELKPGTKVTVESIDGQWCRISSPVSGWIMGKYLTDTPPKGASGGVIASTMTRYITSPNGKKVNLRTGPGLGYGVGTQVEPGTKVDLLSTSKGWSAVKYNGFTVYVQSKFLSRYKPGTEPKKPGAFKSFSGKVYSPNGKKVNMRVRADVNSDRIAQLEPWTSVDVIGESGDWYIIRWANATGYMMRKYVH